VCEDCRCHRTAGTPGRPRRDGTAGASRASGGDGGHGTPGTSRAAGAARPPGAQGPMGAPGATGATGPQGPAGPQGPVRANAVFVGLSAPVNGAWRTLTTRPCVAAFGPSAYEETNLAIINQSLHNIGSNPASIHRGFLFRSLWSVTFASNNCADWSPTNGGSGLFMAIDSFSPFGTTISTFFNNTGCSTLLQLVCLQ
jgi:hypothetical protein